MSRTFRKSGPESALPAFQAEAAGLEALRATGEVRVPAVVDVGLDAGGSFLETEFLDFGATTPECAGLLGTRLARLHRHTAERFGWDRDNTIGLTPQVNDWNGDWIAFFREQRLGYQVSLATRNGFDLVAAGAALARCLPALFEGYEPEPSLLHGDLWGGNWGCVRGEPVVFDPAVYFGDRESDIAMTMLFGGFDRSFYAAYAKEWPLAPGHERRLKLYQLYHVLNHLNLFGRGYLGRARQLFGELS